MNLEILIQSGNNPENRKLDLIPDLSFPISYLISTIEDISATKGGISKTITLPDTPHNRELLGYLTDLSVDLGYNYYSGLLNSYNPNLKVPCVVLEDSIPITNNACIQIIGFDIMNSVNVINAMIYDGNTSLINDIGEMFLTDLDFSDYNFTYSVNAVTQSWNNAVDSYKLGYYCLLADYGNSRLTPLLNSNGVDYLKLSDFFPGPYVKTIWDKIFKTKGYVVDSTFTENNANPDVRFGSLIIPYNKQLLQTDPIFIQDKIFHVGLSSSNIQSQVPLYGGSYSYTSYMATYIGKTYSGGSSYAKSIINMRPGYSDDRSLWYSGLCLNPWKYSSDMNNSSLDPTTLQPQGFTTSYYTMTGTIVPFDLTDSPMFQGTYDVINHNYTGNTNSGVYKQFFTLNTDFVTNYSVKYVDPAVPATPFTYMRGIACVKFYREYKPSSIAPGTYSIDPGFAGGTGSIIPAYMGDNITNAAIYTTCVDENGNMDQLTHWICDRNNRSNVYTKAGKLIVPNDYTDSAGNAYSRYLGDYYVNDTGVYVAEPTDDGSVFYPKNSGDCIAWFNNFKDTAGRPDLVGLWVSGHESPPLVDGSTGTEKQFWYRSAHGDWYQQLAMNTITLDGDVTNPFYGSAGSRMVNGNKPIQPGERVRCVVSFGSFWPGSRPTSTQGAYMPPSVGYLLTNTYFKNMPAYPYGTYQNPATYPETGSSLITNFPLTQFFNTVNTEYIDQSTIKFNDLIPKNIKVKDFLKDIIQKHCLYIEPSRENPKKLTIETRDTFFNGSVLDWSRKLDISRPINIQLLADTQNKKTTFTYKSDNDWYNKQYTQFTNEIYGQQLFISPNQFSTSEKKIESIFSPTPLVPIYTQFGANNVAQPGTFVVPTIVNGANVGKSLIDNIPNGYIQSNYRILQRKYIQNTNGDTLPIFGTKTDWYPYAGPYADPYADNPYTINWGSTKGEFINRNTSDITNNLVNNYWATYLTELQDMDSRLITCYMFLTAVDIHNFSFRNLVRVNINNVDVICKVNSIEDYIPGANVPCKVVLLKSKTFTTPLVFTDSLGNTI